MRFLGKIELIALVCAVLGCYSAAQDVLQKGSRMPSPSSSRAATCPANSALTMVDVFVRAEEADSEEELDKLAGAFANHATSPTYDKDVVAAMGDVLRQSAKDQSEAFEACDRLLAFLARPAVRSLGDTARTLSDQVLDAANQSLEADKMAALLERAVFRGQYETVIHCATIRIAKSKEQQSVPFQRLRARGASALYRRYEATHARLEWPTEQEALEFRRLARACTDAYEKAMRSSTDTFERRCLAVEWWALMKQPYFDADSRELRDAALPPAFKEPITHDADSLLPRNDERREAVTKRLSGFKAKVMASLNKSPWAEKTSQQMRERMALTCQNVLLRLGIEDVPQDVLAELGRDVGTFWLEGLPSVQSEQALTATFEWYLWQALITPRPGAYERGMIRRDTAAFAALVKHWLETTLSHPKFGNSGEKVYRTLNTQHDRYARNCFIPYFKHALLPFQREGEMRLLQQKLGSLASSAQASVEDRVDGAEADRALWSRQEEAILKALLPHVYLRLTSRDRPVFNAHVPGRITTACGGYFNEHNVYTFVIRMMREAPSFEWRKRVLPGEADTSRASDTAVQIPDPGTPSVLFGTLIAPPGELAGNG